MTMFDNSERSNRGAALQAEITASAGVAPATPLEESLRDFVFAEVWSRPGLDRLARYLISLAGAALAGADGVYLDSYVHGALRDGVLTQGELREAALHLAVYAGWTRGRLLDGAVTRVAHEMGLPAAECAPIRGAPCATCC